MARLAKVSPETAEVRDFAPGVDNCVLRKDGIEFYAPATFHTSPFYNHITPVLVCDIVNSRDICEVYGIDGMAAARANVVLLRNHPVRKVRIMGRITEYTVKEYSAMRAFYFLTIDDSSGEEIVCKITKSKFIGSGFSHQGCEWMLVHITGFARPYNGKMEMDVEFIELLEQNRISLRYEMEFWKAAIKMRRVLKTPWYQTPLIDDSEIELKIRMDPVALRRKLMVKNMAFSDDSHDDMAVVLDSCIYTRKKALKKAEGTTVLEVHDETDSDSDVEEITQEVFQRKSLLELPIHCTPPSSFDSTWTKLACESHPLRETSQTSQQKLVLLLINYFVHHPNEKAHLNDALNSSPIAQLLNRDDSPPSPEIIDLTSNDHYHIPNQDVNLHEIHPPQFTTARRIIQQTGLIRCFKSGSCKSQSLKKFHAHLESTLSRIKSLAKQRNGITLLLGNYVDVYNHEHDTAFVIDVELLDLIVFDMIGAEEGWWYRSERHEWAFEGPKKRELKVRKKSSVRYGCMLTSYDAMI